MQLHDSVFVVRLLMKPQSSICSLSVFEDHKYIHFYRLWKCRRYAIYMGKLQYTVTLDMCAYYLLSFGSAVILMHDTRISKSANNTYITILCLSMLNIWTPEPPMAVYCLVVCTLNYIYMRHGIHYISNAYGTPSSISYYDALTPISGKRTLLRGLNIMVYCTVVGESSVKIFLIGGYSWPSAWKFSGRFLKGFLIFWREK